MKKTTLNVAVAALAALCASGLISGCTAGENGGGTGAGAAPAGSSAPGGSPAPDGSPVPSGSGGGASQGPSPDAASPAPGAAGERERAAAAYRKWGLKPFPEPPAPPTTKPVRTPVTGADKVPVISEIPTEDKVVFVTIDDGAEKDPEFVTMMRDLNVPFTMFLTDSEIRSDYGYFKPLAALGNGVANHTLTHPDLRTLGADAQRKEICGQQTKLKDTYGTAPRLFRPPYGNWNEDTRAAAAACGVDAIVLWRESMQIHDMQYQRGDRRLRPGDIILAHFRGPEDLKGATMTEMTAAMLRRIQEQGFTVARLEDYV